MCTYIKVFIIEILIHTVQYNTIQYINIVFTLQKDRLSTLVMLKRQCVYIRTYIYVYIFLQIQLYMVEYGLPSFTTYYISDDIPTLTFGYNIHLWHQVDIIWYHHDISWYIYFTMQIPKINIASTCFPGCDTSDISSILAPPLAHT